MPDSESASKAFRVAADRVAYEKQQLLDNLPEQARKLLADTAAKAQEEREAKLREQQEHRDAEIEKEKQRLEKQDALDQTHPPPPGLKTGKPKSLVSSQTRAEGIVDERHKAELGTLDARHQQRLETILAEHGIDKARALDKDRRHMEELAAQKRADRNATRPDAGRGEAPSPEEPAKDTKTREKEFLERVAARLRKGRQYDAHERGGHGRE